MRALVLSLGVVVALLFTTLPAAAQAPAEYRAYWVETFNTLLGTRAQIDRVIQNCVDGNCNAIFAQVRRRGDSWYLDTLEPLTQVAGVGEPVGGTWTLDPLRYLIDEAHERGIEVHAFVIITAIYNSHPTLVGVPTNPNHIFNQHFWNKAATPQALYPITDPRQWSTRALPHNQDTTTFNGHRFAGGSEWYVDLGHPEAAAYTVDVLTHLVRQYDVDGIHLDRIRYPEAPINNLNGALSINVGYNETSVQRFKARHGTAANYYQPGDIGLIVSNRPAGTTRTIGAQDVGYPRTNDALWNQWRRDQVTSFVRRLYLNATAVKPTVKVSAALICFFTAPPTVGAWTNTEAYYRVFQDWRAWSEEGILDVLAPMVYKREHTTNANPNLNERLQFDEWTAFTKTLATNTGRHSMIGLGGFINSIEGTLRQIRKARAVPAADGTILFAIGNTTPGTLVGNSTNVAVTANSVSFPTPGVNTPKWPNSEYFAAVMTGTPVLHESSSLDPVFKDPAPAPAMPWKVNNGHIMGFARREDGTAVDSGAVMIDNPNTGVARTSKTDGHGFFGAPNLGPGSWRAMITLGAEKLFAPPTPVTAGAVATTTASVDHVAPSIAIDVPADGAQFVYGQVASSLFSCEDTLAGIVTCSASAFDTWSVGAKTFAVDSTDRAGNAATKSHPYIVNRAATEIAFSYEEERNWMTLIARVSALAPSTAVPDGPVEFFDKNKDSLGTAPLVAGEARLRVHKRALHLRVVYAATTNFEGSETPETLLVPRPD